MKNAAEKLKDNGKQAGLQNFLSKIKQTIKQKNCDRSPRGAPWGRANNKKRKERK